jgi:predicted nucleotidyltransferase
MVYSHDVGKRDWENTFNSWAQAPGKTEQERCERAVNAIKKSIAASPKLSQRSVRTFAQGSYANRTNVRKDSDVDVCVLCDDICTVRYPDGVTDANTGLSNSDYTYEQYKDEVEAALVDYFGRENVIRGNKAFDIHENTYRVDADAVACIEYRYYFHTTDGKLTFIRGTALRTDRENNRVTNFPELQYDNGVTKNNATGRRFNPYYPDELLI